MCALLIALDFAFDSSRQKVTIGNVFRLRTTTHNQLSVLYQVRIKWLGSNNHRRFHFVRDHFEKDMYKVEHVPGELQLTDFLTKGLSR